MRVATSKLLTNLFFAAMVAVGFSSTTSAAPGSELLDFWDESDDENTATIDHNQWQQILDKYLISDHESGINRFDYKAVSKEDTKLLKGYIGGLEKLDPRDYSLAEQKAYWINIYNALTVEVILDNYPVSSITKLGGFFAFGPWDQEATTIQGEELTLNNIEHGILRPIWQDNRIHYAVNCASMGCPNLAGTAYTAENTEEILEQAAKDYVNHERGVTFEGEKLKVSSIYHWYKVDFGDNNDSLVEHLKQYAEPELKAKLEGFDGKLTHDYDWKLNQP